MTAVLLHNALEMHGRRAAGNFPVKGQWKETAEQESRHMEYAAIRHYADKRYCYATEKGHFVIRLEVKKGDALKVILHTQNKYLPLAYMDTRQECVMEPAYSDDYIDYYETEVDLDVVCLRYFFEIEDWAGKVVYYGNHGFYDQCITSIDRMFDCPQTLREEERFELPSWAENKVIYQIFPSRFATDKEVSEEDWYQAPIGGKADLKGSLRGIIEHFDHIRNLGVDILYLTPIFRSDSVHKYNTADYYEIDASFGDKEDLKELVRLAHGAGMYVILDGVFNHTGIDFFAFRDIMEKQDKSAYVDWYYIESFPLVMEWGKRPGYKTFSYAGYMPKLNLQNPETADYVINVAAYWIRECDIDGWRLDVADEISHSFWKRFRREMKAVKKDILLVGEVWHYAGDFLEGDEWDSVMNYPFYDAVVDLIVREELTPSGFRGKLNFVKGNLNKALEGYLWNFIDTHDTARFLHSAGNDMRKQNLAAAMQLLLPGMPMIYYGDEVGMEGGPDPDCRRGMLWDKKRQKQDCLAYYRRLIRIRHQYPVLTKGIMAVQYGEDEKGLLYMERKLDEQRIILIFHVRKGIVRLPGLEGWRNLITEEDFSGSLGEYEAAVLVPGAATY
ncbi:Neopullulanase [Acetatifactor muris]|uniref:Neopullulanase n=1 Tax=Acetatifactor muris TaxID=879566 RepID=A0A2K4ZPJ1_9FIRM|nr:alpha amylase N-terminal ig-like domain-containing protein [Acetatifactor muris]SOY32414.1 Neopullulanase [Acetatifactor muris]